MFDYARLQIFARQHYLTVLVKFVFDYARLQIRIEFLDDYACDEFWGAKLRGGFGFALKDERRTLFKPVRLALQAKPSGKPLGNNENSPPPFVLKTPLAPAKQYRRGDNLTFDLILFGAAVGRFRVIVEAFAKFGEAGLTHEKRRARFRLRSVADALARQTIFQTDSAEHPALAASSPVALTTHSASNLIEPPTGFSPPQNVVLHFMVPVRVERKSPRRCDPVSGLTIFSDCYDFVFDLTERVAEIWQLYGKDWIGQADYFRRRENLLKASRRIAWRDSLSMQRRECFSSTQDARLPVDGFTGAAEMAGDLSTLWGLLRLGELVHVGQMTSFSRTSVRIFHRIFLVHVGQMTSFSYGRYLIV